MFIIRRVCSLDYLFNAFLLVKIGIMYFSYVALSTWKLHDVLWKVLSCRIEHLYSADGSIFLTIMVDSDCSGSFLTRKLVLDNPNA